ncbi:hypothetical protein [Methanosarcina sp. MSH10X1]|nr:hypothetical protein [Methanosarcina sp. MSH10X1]
MAGNKKQAQEGPVLREELQPGKNLTDFRRDFKRNFRREFRREFGRNSK